VLQEEILDVETLKIFTTRLYTIRNRKDFTEKQASLSLANEYKDL